MRDPRSRCLEDPALADPAAVAADAFTWLTTGEVGEALTQHLSVVERLAASADVTLGVDLTIASVEAEIEEEAGVGVMESAHVAGGVGLVYQRDRVLGELCAPPSIDELLSVVRAGGRGRGGLTARPDKGSITHDLVAFIFDSPYERLEMRRVQPSVQESGFEQ
ncbi:MAG: hypothetical protein ABMA64_24870 [Myxococcota bacterium]